MKKLSYVLFGLYITCLVFGWVTKSDSVNRSELIFAYSHVLALFGYLLLWFSKRK